MEEYHNMRKTLSVLLCAVMIVSMLTIGISAVDGTAINSAADFAAMAADGVYYLNADIKIDTTYVTAFKGTFDGNGHTVTVTVPMFADFNGIVKNLTINGTEISGAEDLAAFAVFTTDGMTAINVVNNVDITVTGANADITKGLKAGGILADSDVASLSKFRSCINNGDISIQTTAIKDAAKGTHYETHAGGIVGRADGLEAKYCENNGKITNISNLGQAGGIAGRVAYFASLSNCDIVDCSNTGDISSAYDAGGIVANLGVKGNSIYMPYTIKYCVNTGEIAGGYRAGGFVGYCYAGGDQYIEITSSITIADVKAGRPATDLAGTSQSAYVSLIMAYSNSVNNVISDCLAVGELSAITGDNYNTPYRTIHGCSSAKSMDEQHHDNYICDNGTTEWYTYATGTNTAQQILIADAISTGKVTPCTLDELKSGTILDKLNKAADTAVFAQKVGTDLYPTIDLTLRAQRAAADVIVEETTAPDTTAPITTAPVVTTAKPSNTTAPKETTAKPSDTTVAATTAGDTEKGGCGSVFAGSIALVAIFGGALVLGKKRKV